MFREKGRAHGFHFFRNLPPELFIRLMAHCACMVGNSSAALREGAFLGVPAVTVGTRQQNARRGRTCGASSYDSDEIAQRDRDQIAHGPYEPDHLFGDGTAGLKIADILATVDAPVQKRLHYEVDGLLQTPLKT